MSYLNIRWLILVYASVRSLVLCDAVKARRNVIQRTPIPWNLTQMILEGYDPRLRPNFGNPNKPVEVKVDLVVGSVDEISEVNMDFTLTIYLRQYWKDHRLSFKHILGEDIKVMPVDGRITDKLWLPDTYFTNDKDSYLQDITVKNRMVRIMKDGTVVFGLRLSITASCVFELKKFPHDKQTCALFLESYGYNTRDIRLLWEEDCVSGFEGVQLPQFRVTAWHCSSLMANFSSGFYDRLNLEFVLSREVGFFVFQTYMPCIMVVCMSWVSFWINNESSPARVALGITTVLTMTTIFTSSRASLPRFSYVKAIDIYLLTCFVFVFASLIEYAIVNFNYWKLTHNRNKELKKQQKAEAKAEQKRLEKMAAEGISEITTAESLRFEPPTPRNNTESNLVNRTKSFPLPAQSQSNLVMSGNIAQTNNTFMDSQSFDQLSMKSLYNDSSVPYRNGDALPTPTSFHPGYIRTIQFADYGNSPNAPRDQQGQFQNHRAYIVQQNGNEGFYPSNVQIPVFTGNPSNPSQAIMAAVPYVPANVISRNPQRRNLSADGLSFTTMQPGGYTLISQSSQPFLSPVQKEADDFRGGSSNEWQEIKSSVSKVCDSMCSIFNRFPIPSGQNVIVIDAYSRIFFPIAFVIFNLLYWWHYIMDSDSE